MTKKMNQMRAVTIAASLAGCAWSGHASAQETAGVTATPPPPQQDTMAESTAREADLTDQRARAHYTVGVAMYEAGRFPEAATEFQSAYDLSHRPQLLYNCYVAYRDSSQATRARDSLAQYLAELPDAPNRLHLMARLEALNADIAAAEAIAAEREAQRLTAEQAARDAALAQQAAEHTAEQLSHVRPWWPWALFGTGLAMVGVGVPLGVTNGDRAAAVRTACTQPAFQSRPSVLGCGTPELDAQRSDVLLMAGVADALWITGTALSAASLVLAFLVPDDIVDVSGTSAMCSQDGCFGQLSIRTW